MKIKHISNHHLVMCVGIFDCLSLIRWMDVFESKFLQLIQGNRLKPFRGATCFRRGTALKLKTSAPRSTSTKSNAKDQAGTAQAKSKASFFWELSGKYRHMAVEPKNRGTPKWKVKIMENPMNKWMIWGPTPIFEPIHLKKYAQVKMDHFPKVRGENKKSLKPPPSFGK